MSSLSLALWNCFKRTNGMLRFTLNLCTIGWQSEITVRRKRPTLLVDGSAVNTFLANSSLVFFSNDISITIYRQTKNKQKMKEHEVKTARRVPNNMTVLNGERINNNGDNSVYNKNVTNYDSKEKQFFKLVNLVDWRVASFSIIKRLFRFSNRPSLLRFIFVVYWNILFPPCKRNLHGDNFVFIHRFTNSVFIRE